MVWYSHLFQNFPQFIVIHTVKGFGIVNKVNLTQMTIISTTVGKNPLEEMEQPSWSTEDSKMQYLDAVSKMTE